MTTQLEQLLNDPAAADRLSPQAQEWLAGIRQVATTAQRERALEVNPRPCGTTNEFGQCMSGGHSATCAESMMNETTRASFLHPSDPRYRDAWQKAADERAAHHARYIAPFAEAEARARDERAEAALLRSEAATARRRGALGSSWVESGAVPHELFARR